jgi:hypothetical protein
MESKSNRKGDNIMKTAATADKLTAIDSKKPLTQQELIIANIKLLMGNWKPEGQKHSPTTSWGPT